MERALAEHAGAVDGRASSSTHGSGSLEAGGAPAKKKQKADQVMGASGPASSGPTSSGAMRVGKGRKSILLPGEIEWIQSKQMAFSKLHCAPAEVLKIWIEEGLEAGLLRQGEGITTDHLRHFCRLVCKQ